MIVSRNKWDDWSSRSEDLDANIISALWKIQGLCFGPLPFKNFADIEYIIFDEIVLQGLKTPYINVYLYHPSVKEEISKLGRFYQTTLESRLLFLGALASPPGGKKRKLA